jgi:two-component system, cell cycle response regulator DivK
MTKILYVEDNDDNVFMLKPRLERRGYAVIVAGDGEEGIAMASREKPDLILMDLELPVLDGWEATRQLKSTADTSSIPIIAVSAHAMSGDREKALEAGCDEFAAKPVQLPELLKKIQALLHDDSEGQTDG